MSVVHSNYHGKESTYSADSAKDIERVKEGIAIGILQETSASIAAVAVSVSFLLQSYGIGMNRSGDIAVVLVNYAAAASVYAVLGLSVAKDSVLKALTASVARLGLSGEFLSDLIESVDTVTTGITWWIEDNPSPNPNPHESPGYDDDYKNYFNCKQLAKEWASSKNDPLALDLDGNGIAFTKNSAYFDLGTDGFAERATWIGKGDGLLTLDINGDGKINNGSELFGDAMKKKDGTLAKDGFDALTDYDLNKDGKIDANDEIYSKLKVWVDANGDGITDAGELKTLAELGIKQLNLGNTVVNGAD
ncbi:MAG: hypothetical protein WCV63_07795 [Negativicutes bacterium]|jgi:hypothetical protein